MRVAYVGFVEYPSDSANSQRMHGISKALRLAGHEVIIGSARRESVDEVYGHVTTLAEAPDPTWNKARRVARGLVAGNRTIAWLNSLEPAPDVVILYGTPYGYLTRLLRWSRRKDIPLILDLVEWYESSHMVGGKWGMHSMLNGHSMRRVKEVSGLIAISTHLANAFASPRLPIAVVPPLMTSEAAHHDEPKTGPKLTVAYVGNPGKKDLRTIVNLLHLPSALGHRREEVRIIVAGVRPEAALIASGMTEVPPEVTILGPVSRNHALQVVAESSFTVLQRPDQRFAHAGFPTKVVESLWMGTPVMSNLTSDLDKYLEDGVNAVVLSDDTDKALVAGVSRALDTDYTGFDHGAIAARAREAFGIASHVASLDALLSAVLTSSQSR